VTNPCTTLAPVPRDPDAITEQACQLLTQGHTLRAIALALGVTDASVLWRIMQGSEQRRQRYAHAREMQARTLAEQTLEISDGAEPETVQVARLRTDTRKWLASKLLPREYGDKLEVDAKVQIDFRLVRE